MSQHSQLERAQKYVELCGHGLALTRPLGEGTDGFVWRSSRNTAIKALERMIGYYNEKDAYLRLAEFGLTQKIDQFWVPRLIDYNDELWVIEMEIVTKMPYILDFAKVRIDRPPDFSEETMADYHAEGEQNFGHHWPEVCVLLAALESIGIYYQDPKPKNIAFADLAT